jgi:hypothetical protein
MEDVGIIYRHLVHFTVFCYILFTFGIVRGNLVYFFPFWYFVTIRIWQPCPTERGHSWGSRWAFGKKGSPGIYSGTDGEGPTLRPNHYTRSVLWRSIEEEEENAVNPPHASRAQFFSQKSSVTGLSAIFSAFWSHWNSQLADKMVCLLTSIFV